MYCDLWLQYIKVRKLFKGRNYSRAETIRGNTVTCEFHDPVGNLNWSNGPTIVYVRVFPNWNRPDKRRTKRDFAYYIIQAIDKNLYSHALLLPFWKKKIKRGTPFEDQLAETGTGKKSTVLASGWTHQTNVLQYLNPSKIWILVLAFKTGLFLSLSQIIKYLSILMYLNTLTQQICSLYYCFENMDCFETLKRVKKMECK